MLVFYIAVAIGVLLSEVKKVLAADDHIGAGIIVSFIAALVWPAVFGVRISTWLDEYDQKE